MKGLFGTYAGMCGLSSQDVASLFEVRLDTARSWITGRRAVPNEALDGIIDLWNDLVERADVVVTEMERLSESLGGDPEAVEIGVPSTVEEAQELGLPTPSCWETIGAIAMADLRLGGFEGQLVFVRRGSTPATRGAIYARLGIDPRDGSSL